MAADSQVGTDRMMESAIAFLIVSFSRKLIQNHRPHYPLARLNPGLLISPITLPHGSFTVAIIIAPPTLAGFECSVHQV